MAKRLTETLLKNLLPPAKGNQITYDTDLKGFGVRVTANGAKAFILNYRVGGAGAKADHRQLSRVDSGSGA